jgi:hypothetical protein
MLCVTALLFVALPFVAVVCLPFVGILLALMLVSAALLPSCCTSSLCIREHHHLSP